MGKVLFKGDNRKTAKVKLPSYNYYKTAEGEIIENLTEAKKNKNIVLDSKKQPKVFNDTEVIIYKELTVAGNEKLADLAKETTNEFTLLLSTVLDSIKDWNFTDENDKKVEITEENLKRFSTTDISAIVEVMTGKSLETLAEEGSKKK